MMVTLFLWNKNVCLAKIRTLSTFCLTKTRCEIPLVGPVMLSHVVIRFNYFVLFAHVQLKFYMCMLWPLNLREGKLCGKGLFECPKRVDPPKLLFICPSINSKRLNFRVLTFGICSLPTCGWTPPPQPWNFNWRCATVASCVWHHDFGDAQFLQSLLFGCGKIWFQGVFLQVATKTHNFHM